MNSKVLSLFLASLLIIFGSRSLMIGMDQITGTIICVIVISLMVIDCVRKKYLNNKEQEKIIESLRFLKDDQRQLKEGFDDLQLKMEIMSTQHEDVFKAAEEARKALQNFNLSNSMKGFR